MQLKGRWLKCQKRVFISRCVFGYKPSELWPLTVAAVCADEERVLVELSCGAALAAIYSGVIQRLQAEGRLPPLLDPIVMVVCGGSGISMSWLQKLSDKLRG